MKLLSTATLATAVVAAPAMLEERQACTYGFVFARGSTEPSPLGLLIGPSLQTALRRQLPGLRTYPVYYAASITTNVSVQRTDAASIAKGVAAFRSAKSCRVIVSGGYSQGAAVMVRTLSGNQLDASIKSKVAGCALFGSTLNLQYGGKIPNFPRDKARTWCNVSDGVCGGQLLVNAGHLSYSNTQINEAARWLAGKAKSG